MCNFEKIGNLQLKLHCSVKLADPHCLCTRSAINITNQRVCKLTKATGKSYFFMSVAVTPTEPQQKPG
jgi:hypothetical protein